MSITATAATTRSKVIFLDSGPLGIPVNAKTPPPPLTAAAIRRAASLISNGHRLIVPAIADFEARRELVRAGRVQSVALLEAWNGAQPDRYLPLTDSASKRAAGDDVLRCVCSARRNDIGASCPCGRFSLADRVVL